jgi:cellulose synthase/poly-beta-1,6-N-acetylglucosamine synthase-like glycosyltransferase
VPRLSLVIPFLGDSEALEDTLLSVLENRPEDCEIVVALAAPYDNPYRLEDEVRFVRGPSDGGWIGAVNAGIGVSRAPVVHLLACGGLATAGWADAAVCRFEDPRVAAVVPLVVDRSRPDRLVAAGMTYGAAGEVRSLGRKGRDWANGGFWRQVLGPHPAAVFYRRSALEKVGRFDPYVADHLAGIDMGLILQQLRWHTVLEPRSRVAATAEGPPISRFRAAFEAERFFWRWASAHGWGRSLLLHALLVTGECLTGLITLSIVPRLAGRMLGGCLGILRRENRQRVRQRESTAWRDLVPGTLRRDHEARASGHAVR